MLYLVCLICTKTNLLYFYSNSKKPTFPKLFRKTGLFSALWCCVFLLIQGGGFKNFIIRSRRIFSTHNAAFNISENTINPKGILQCDIYFLFFVSPQMFLTVLITLSPRSPNLLFVCCSLLQCVWVCVCELGLRASVSSVHLFAVSASSCALIGLKEEHTHSLQSL